MKFLICNADDFGISEKISDAIIKGHTGGIITSATLMTNMPAAAYACERVKNLKSLGVGVHLNLTKGKPLSSLDEVAGLVSATGEFAKPSIQRKNILKNKEIIRQIELEFERQICRIFEFGIIPSHCDSHHAIHKIPRVREAMVKVMKMYGIDKARKSGGYYWTPSDAVIGLKLKKFILNMPMMHRQIIHHWNAFQMKHAGISMPDHKVSREMLLGAGTNPKQRLLACIISLRDGVSEIIFHPGYFDESAGDSEKFAKIREDDLALVTDSEIRSAIEKAGVRLISFREL